MKEFGLTIEDEPREGGGQLKKWKTIYAVLDIAKIVCKPPSHNNSKRKSFFLLKNKLLKQQFAYWMIQFKRQTAVSAAILQQKKQEFQINKQVNVPYEWQQFNKIKKNKKKKKNQNQTQIFLFVEK